MRCPKCSYISFDHITSCSKCSNDLTEISTTLKGTGFESLGTFFLGGLIPNYGGAAPMAPMNDIPDFDQEIPDMPISEDLGDPSGLNIDLSDLQELGDLPAMEDDLGGDDFAESDELALDGLEVPEVDLSQFDAGDDSLAVDDDLSLDAHDIPEMDLEGLEMDDSDLSLVEPNEANEDTIFDIAVEGDTGDLPDIEIEGDISMDDDDLPAPVDPAVDLADIDLSLGDDEQQDVEIDDEVMDLADLDLGEAALDMDKDGETMDNEKNAELPDLELE